METRPMRYRYDDLYHDRTWFDELGERVMAPIQRLVPRNRAQLWTFSFALLAALCVAWSAGLAAHTLLFELPPNKALAQLLAAGMLFAAASHFLRVTGATLAVLLPRHKPVRRSTANPAPAFAPEPAGRIGTGTVSNQGAPGPARCQIPAESAQDFFRAVKAAGINVGIARALYAAGFRSADQVRAADDASLLAAPGVGRATLRKLRVQFGLPQS